MTFLSELRDSYSVSPYCRAKAQSAFEKQRTVIPIRVQNVFMPQGWLTFTVSGRMHVDFIKMTKY